MNPCDLLYFRKKNVIVLLWMCFFNHITFPLTPKRRLTGQCKINTTSSVTSFYELKETLLIVMFGGSIFQVCRKGRPINVNQYQTLTDCQCFIGWLMHLNQQHFFIPRLLSVTKKEISKKGFRLHFLNIFLNYQRCVMS